MLDIPAIQRALQEFGLDGWLIYGFRKQNELANRVLGLPENKFLSRRFFYFVPAQGEPRKLVHAIETGALDHQPGEKDVYLRWPILQEKIGTLIGGAKRVAMEYSPGISNPYISRVDAGTIEFVRSLGVEVMSSGNLIQLFEAVWDDDQWQMHLEAAAFTVAAYDLAWKLIADRAVTDSPATEYEVQQAIMEHFHRNSLTTYSPPIVGVGPHSADPHFETSRETDTPIRPGDFVLIDLWAKMDRPRSVYSDLTRVGYVGKTVPSEYEEVFQVVAKARDAAIALVKDAYANKRPIAGWEVDDAGRKVIDLSGYGNFFIHRIGHNIGQEVHGNGAHMDNLETHEERLVLPRTCFSIEPGIYQEGQFGVRSEVNVYVAPDGEVHVTGGLQKRVVPILATPLLHD